MFFSSITDPRKVIWPGLPVLVGMDLCSSAAVVECAKQGVRIPVNGFAAPWKEGALLFKEVAAGLSYSLAPSRNLPPGGRSQLR